MKIGRRIGFLITGLVLGCGLWLIAAGARSWFEQVKIDNIAENAVHGSEIDQVVSIFVLPAAMIFSVVWGIVIGIVTLVIIGIYWLIYSIVYSSKKKKGLIPERTLMERKWESYGDLGICLTPILCWAGWYFSWFGFAVAVVLNVIYWIIYYKKKQAAYNDQLGE